MKINLWVLVSLAALLIFQPRILAIDLDFTDADARRAIGIAIGARAARAQFHEPYLIPVKDATVEHVQVITEFRRFVMVSEEQALRGNWMLARGGFDSKGRTLRDINQQWRGQVSIKTGLRFHPHNTYSTIPAVEILIGEPSFLPLDATRTPIISSPPAGSRFGPMTGAIIEVFFNAASFQDRVLPVRIVFEGKELVRATVDFSRLE
jgi:hypothetical protein